jgi:hypothetical protein
MATSDDSFQLHSVRFSHSQLQKVAAVAFVLGAPSNAEIIRQAVDELVDRHLADPEFRKKYDQRRQEQDALVEDLLRRANPDPPSN